MRWILTRARSKKVYYTRVIILLLSLLYNIYTYLYYTRVITKTDTCSSLRWFNYNGNFFNFFFLLPAAISAQKVAVGRVMTADDVCLYRNSCTLHARHDNVILVIYIINYDKIELYFTTSACETHNNIYYFKYYLSNKLCTVLPLVLRPAFRIFGIMSI